MIGLATFFAVLAAMNCIRIRQLDAHVRRLKWARDAFEKWWWRELDNAWRWEKRFVSCRREARRWKDEARLATLAGHQAIEMAHQATTTAKQFQAAYNTLAGQHNESDALLSHWVVRSLEGERKLECAQEVNRSLSRENARLAARGKKRLTKKGSRK